MHREFHPEKIIKYALNTYTYKLKRVGIYFS